MRKIVIDPVTRIEGHLRVEVIVENGKVVSAWTKGTMFRGLEQILQGRDPRDAIYIVERICGVCMASHGWTAALAVEDAYGIEVPPAARLIRNLLVGALWLHDHPLHFYHLSALDYLDVMAVKEYQGKAPNLLAVKERIKKLAESGDMAPLTPRYEPDQFTISDPEIVTTAVAHYLQALHIQARAKKMSAVFGGKQPHQSSIVVGGVTLAPTKEQLLQFRHLLGEVTAFIKTVYVPDVVNLATGPLLPLAQAGMGRGPGNYLAYGGFPLNDSGEKLFQGGFIGKDQLEKVEPVDESRITEAVTHSWYKTTRPLHPREGKTEVDLDKWDAYSFVKAPRYQDLPVEVGPLARLMVKRHEPYLSLVKKYDIKPGAVARHLARAQETIVVVDAMWKWLQELEALVGKGGRLEIHNSQGWEPGEKGRGIGFSEAPRGALGHWVEIENHKVKNYQLVVPTTWNVSPRDNREIPGPMEQALLGLPVDPDNPINVVRVIRSFDPCLACAVHVVSDEGEKMIQV